MRPAKNREPIIKSSLKLFYEKGFKNTSIREITEDAGVSPGNVYNYFKNKKSIFDYIFRLYFPGNHIELFLNGITGQDSIDHVIEKVLNNIVSFVEDNPYFFRLVVIDTNEFQGYYLKKYSRSFAKPIYEYFDDTEKIPALRDDIDAYDLTGFFSWLFYSIGLTDVMYSQISGCSLKETPEYRTLLKIVINGLRK